MELLAEIVGIVPDVYRYFVGDILIGFGLWDVVGALVESEGCTLYEDVSIGCDSITVVSGVITIPRP